MKYDVKLRIAEFLGTNSFIDLFLKFFWLSFIPFLALNCFGVTSSHQTIFIPIGISLTLLSFRNIYIFIFPKRKLWRLTRKIGRKSGIWDDME
jgi:hypothetical protein